MKKLTNAEAGKGENKKEIDANYIKRFMKGVEEYNEIREICIKVIAIIKNYFVKPNDLYLWKHNANHEDVVFVQFPDYRTAFIIRHVKKDIFLCGFVDAFARGNKRWKGERYHHVDEISKEYILMLYDLLPEIVEKTNNAFPALKIKGYFDFFIDIKKAKKETEISFRRGC